MKHIRIGLLLFSSAVAWSACQKNIDSPALNAGEIPAHARSVQGPGGPGGHVYILSNQTDANAVMDYNRSEDGTLSLAESVSTAGQGTGAGLGNQGAMTLAGNGRFLLAVNPASNSIASLRITGSGLKLIGTFSSDGEQPVSITEKDNLVYVLNSGGEGNIAGFRLLPNGSLIELANSVRSLSSPAAGAAQVSFVWGRKVLAVTEKVTNMITTYTLNLWGIPETRHSISSANATPFGFAVGLYGNIYVSEAAGGAPGASTVSSYKVQSDGTVSLTKGPVSAGQTAACWVALGGFGKYAYATNTGSNNVSSFRLNPFSGDLEVAQAEAGATDMGPIDIGVSSSNRFVYVLNAKSHSISVFEAGEEGRINPIQSVEEVPAGATGCIAN